MFIFTSLQEYFPIQCPESDYLLNEEEIDDDEGEVSYKHEFNPHQELQKRINVGRIQYIDCKDCTEFSNILKFNLKIICHFLVYANPGQLGTGESTKCLLTKNIYNKL